MVDDPQPRDTFASRRAHAQDAVNAAGKKIDALKSRRTPLTDPLVRVINEDPVKAMLAAAAGGSILTAL